ncbi:MAG: hypothetical protein HY244_18785 [Rhizobiales bacterium]|nr:hypothetical protein [Hyphomicrobiales bacterium]
MPAYEDRYVAFVDILGFRKLIESVTEGRTDPLWIVHLLRAVHDPPRIDRETDQSLKGVCIASGGFRAQSISDAVVISADLDLWGLYHICYSLTKLATELLVRGIFLRGAITKGKLYHDEKTVFGPGLVRAYDFESRVAYFPRIVVTRDVCIDVEAKQYEFPWDSNFKDILLQADDGPIYLNVLERVVADLKTMDRDKAPSRDELMRNKQYAAIDIMRDEIQDCFDASTDDPSIFKKMQWFARYWNRVIPNDLVPPITGPGAALDNRPVSASS